MPSRQKHTHTHTRLTHFLSFHGRKAHFSNFQLYTIRDKLIKKNYSHTRISVYANFFCAIFTSLTACLPSQTNPADYAHFRLYLEERESEKE